jgi:hypothetical protein
MTGEPLIFGTFGRDAALGLPGLTAPGIAGCRAEGAVPVPELEGPEPAVAPVVGLLPVDDPPAVPAVCADAGVAIAAAIPQMRASLDKDRIAFTQ